MDKDDLESFIRDLRQYGNDTVISLCEDFEDRFAEELCLSQGDEINVVVKDTDKNR